MEIRPHVIGSICLPDPAHRRQLLLGVHNAVANVRRFMRPKVKAAAFTATGVAGGTGLSLLGFDPVDSVSFGAAVTATLFKLFPLRTASSKARAVKEEATLAVEPVMSTKAEGRETVRGRTSRHRRAARGARSFAARVRRSGRPSNR